MVALCLRPIARPVAAEPVQGEAPWWRDGRTYLLLAITAATLVVGWML